MMFLAQVTPNPDPSIAWNVILTIGVLVAIAVNLMGVLRKPNMAITPDPLRIEKLDKFATRDFCEMKHTEVRERLAKHDTDIAALWNTLRNENEAIRLEMRKGFGSMERSLGRIEGKIDDKQL